MIIELESIKKVVEYHFKQKNVKGFEPNMPDISGLSSEDSNFLNDAYNALDPSTTGTVTITLPSGLVTTVGPKYKLIDQSGQWRVKETKSQKQDIQKNSAGTIVISDVTKTTNWSYNDNLDNMRDAIASSIYDILTNTTVSGDLSIPGTKTTKIVQTMNADDPALPVSIEVVNAPETIVDDTVGTQTISNSPDVVFKAPPASSTGDPAPSVTLESNDGSHWARVNDSEVVAGNASFRVSITDSNVQIGRADGTYQLRTTASDIEVSDNGITWRSLFDMVNNHRHSLPVDYASSLVTEYTSI